MHRSRWTALLITILVAACSSSPGVTVTPRASTPAASETPGTSAPTALETAEAADLVLLAIGDSIAVNSPNDCPGCIGYVDQYGTAIAAATGKSVRVVNLSKHSGLTSDGLLRDLGADDVRTNVAGADAITVSIGFNDSPMVLADDPCDGPADEPQLATYTDACMTAWANAFGQRLAKILDQVSELRGSKPTLVTVITVFDQWLGFAGNSASVTANIGVVKTVLEKQNAKICSIAAAHHALCADLHAAFNGQDHGKPSGALLGEDYAHPSQAGNDLIAKTLVQLGFGPLR